MPLRARSIDKKGDFMPTEPRLEQYLTALDKALGQIPVSDRSDIITEIRSHILEALERDPSQETGKLLEALGEPQNVANRYLLERGIKPGRPSRTPIIKWLITGFVGTFGLILLFILTLIWKFTPILKVDQKAGKVVFLGGMVEVNDPEGSIKIGDASFMGDQHNMNIQKGSVVLNSKKIQMIHIPFSNGKIKLSPSATTELKWKCKLRGPQDLELKQEDGKTFRLNLDKSPAVSCDIELPGQIETKLEGANGKIDVEHPQTRLDIRLNNGKIGIKPDAAKEYHYETHIVNGYAKGLESSDKKDAIVIKMTLTNGVVHKN